MKTKAIVQLSLALSVFCSLQIAGNCPAAPAKNANYKVTEDRMVFTKPGTWFYGMDNKLYIRGVEMTAEDTATDERLTGTVTLTFDMIWALPEKVGPVWSSYVKLENHHADAAKNGWWEGYCFGSRELMEDGVTVRSWFEGTMEGRGIHQGLLARYWYEGVNVMETGLLSGHGYVVERGAPVRPIQVRTTHTHLATIVPGVYVQPFTGVPIDEKDIQILVYWWIKEASGNISHLGPLKENGFGIFDMGTGKGSGMGYQTAANGDKTYWIVGVNTISGNSTRLVANYAGGTGRFEAAVGGYETIAQEEVSAPDPKNPLLLQMDFAYSASGWIRY